MFELGGWGPLILLWVAGGAHITWIVWRERTQASDQTPRKRAA